MIPCLFPSHSVLKVGLRAVSAEEEQWHAVFAAATHADVAALKRCTAKDLVHWSSNTFDQMSRGCILGVFEDESAYGGWIDANVLHVIASVVAPDPELQVEAFRAVLESLSPSQARQLLTARAALKSREQWNYNGITPLHMLLLTCGSFHQDHWCPARGAWGHALRTSRFDYAAHARLRPGTLPPAMRDAPAQPDEADFLIPAARFGAIGAAKRTCLSLAMAAVGEACGELEAHAWYVRPLRQGSRWQHRHRTLLEFAVHFAHAPRVVQATSRSIATPATRY